MNAVSHGLHYTHFVHLFLAESEKSSSVSKEEMQQVINDRDQALDDLQSVETAFSDLHRRYEKTKAVVEGFKKVGQCTFRKSVM